MQIWVGTSGFSYKHWRGGVFYPQGLPVSQEFAFYNRNFATVELNNPFYRLPSREQFVRWRRSAAPGFLFAVKASRYITHNKKLLDPEPSLALLAERLEGLGPKLGPVLFQLPASFKPNLERLQAFLAAVPRRWRVAMEFRHPGWFTPEVYAVLQRRSAALCWAVSPQSPEPARVRTAKFVYLRMHGGQAQGANFGNAELRKWARRLTAEQAVEAFVYFNNDWEGFAPANALAFRALLEQRRRTAA